MVEAFSNHYAPNDTPSQSTEQQQQQSQNQQIMDDSNLIPWDFPIDGEQQVELLRCTSDHLVEMFLEGTDDEAEDDLKNEEQKQDSILLSQDETKLFSTGFDSRNSRKEEFPLPEYGANTAVPRVGHSQLMGNGVIGLAVSKDCGDVAGAVSCASDGNRATPGGSAPPSCDFADSLLRQALLEDAVDDCPSSVTAPLPREEDGSMIASQVFSDFLNDVVSSPPRSSSCGEDGEGMRRATPSPPPLSDEKSAVVPPPPPPFSNGFKEVQSGCKPQRSRRGTTNTSKSKKGGTATTTTRKNLKKGSVPPPPPPPRPDMTTSSSIALPPIPDVTPSASTTTTTTITASNLQAKLARQSRMAKLASRNIGIAPSSRRHRIQRDALNSQVAKDAEAGLQSDFLSQEEVARVAHELLLDVQCRGTGTGMVGFSTGMESVGNTVGDVGGAGDLKSPPPLLQNQATGQQVARAQPPPPTTSPLVSTPDASSSRLSASPPPVPVIFTTTTTPQENTIIPQVKSTTAKNKRKKATTAKRTPKTKTPPAKKKKTTKGNTPATTTALVSIPKPKTTKKSTPAAPPANPNNKKKKTTTPKQLIKTEDTTEEETTTPKKKEGPRTHINGVPLPTGNDAESRRQRRLIRNRMSAQLHRERKREAIENYQKQVQERDLVIDGLRSELVQTKARNAELEEIISKLQLHLGEEVFRNIVSSGGATQVLPPSSPPHLVNDSDQSIVTSPFSPYADRCSGSEEEEETDALSTVPSSPVSYGSPCHGSGEVQAPSNFALPLSVSSASAVSEKRRRDVALESSCPPTTKGRVKKKKGRASSASLFTLSSVAICGVLGCIALISSPSSVQLSRFAPSWLVAEKNGLSDEFMYKESENHRRLTVDLDVSEEGLDVGDDDTAPGAISSVKVSQTMVPARQSWVISPLELHPERWAVHRDRPWTVQNSFVLFDKSVVVNPAGSQAVTYQEAFRQQLCRALLTTDVVYPSTMGTMAILCSPAVNRIVALPSPPPKTESKDRKDVSSSHSSSPSQRKSGSKPIVNVQKDASQASTMKPARLRGASPVDTSPLETSGHVDELVIVDQADKNSEEDSDFSMDSSASSLFSVTSLSSRPLLYPGGDQHIDNHDKSYSASRNGNNINSRHRPGQNGDNAEQDSTSFLFCPSAHASVSSDFLELIGDGVSSYGSRSKNPDWNTREDSGILDGVFSDIDLDFVDFDDEDDNSNSLYHSYEENSDGGSPLFDDTDSSVIIEHDHEEEGDVDLRDVDLKYTQDDDDCGSACAGGGSVGGAAPQLWYQGNTNNQDEEETKALVPTFGQRGVPFDPQRPLYSDKRVAQTSLVDGSNDQYPNMVILVPLSAVHGNGSGIFREGYEDIPVSEQPWIELDCSVTSARIVDGIEFISDDAMREDRTRADTK